MIQLSFATYDNDGRVTDYWSPVTAGDWSVDNAMGKEYGAEAVRRMAFDDATPTLGFIVKAMMVRGQFGGVEAGFCQKVAENAVSMGLG